LDWLTSARFMAVFPARFRPWLNRLSGPIGAIVGLFTRIRNRPDWPFWPNDSV
jgi:hypothetical protein